MKKIQFPAWNHKCLTKGVKAHEAHKKIRPYIHLYAAVLVFLFTLQPPFLHADTISDLSIQANNGSTRAMLTLARIYEDSESSHFSLTEAFKWYLSSAELGSARAQRAIGAMYELGQGTTKDYQEAAHWYEKAADQGLARAQTNLGNLYENGLGVLPDPNKAFSLYQAAAKQGYARGQVFLGKMYEVGNGVMQDYSKARHWYREAAIQGYSRGQLELGRLFEEGLGVEQDYTVALKWYKKSKSQGFQPAQKRLNKLENLVASRNNVNEQFSNEPDRIFVPPEYVAHVNELSRYELRKLANDETNIAQTEAFSSVMQMECSDFSLHYLDREILSIESEIERDNPGLKFEAGHRFRVGDVNDDRHATYIGLSWDILNEGAMENESQSRRFSYQREIEDLRAEQKRHTELFKCRDNYLISSFNALKQSVQEKKKEVLSQLFTLSRKAYFLGDILADDLLKIEFDVQKTDTILDKYRLQSQQTFVDQHNLLPDLPEAIAPNLDAIIAAIESDSTYQKVGQLSQAILEEKYDPFHDKRLRFYLKAGVNENENDLSSGDLTAGVYFSTPLAHRKKDILPYKIHRAKKQLKKEQDDVLTETIRLHNSYTNRLTDAIKMYYQLQTVGERLRRSLLLSENRKQNSGTYGFDEHLLALRHLDELLDTRFEYIAVQESLYRQLLHMFTLTQTNWQQNYTEQVALGSEMKRGRKGDRSVYIWSEEFNKYDNKVLQQVFIAKRVSTAIISASKTINKKKLAHFINLAELNGITVELMLSENSWVLPEKWPDVKQTVEELCQFGQTVHLDIEAHTLSDYPEKKQIYDTYFFDLISKIQTITKNQGVNLNISLPVLHDAEYVEAIASLADHVYIMAYGNLDQNKLKAKMAPFANIDKNKLVLALRPRDFSNELRQEEFIDSTYDQTGLEAFALHDLAQFIQIAGK